MNMENPIISPATRAGTAGGTLLVLLFNIFSTTDILHTVIVSGVGAAVSFTVSLLLKTLVRKLKNKGESAK